jgi:hypothetical protein
LAASKNGASGNRARSDNPRTVCTQNQTFRDGHHITLRYCSGCPKDWLKFKNPDAPTVKDEAEEDRTTKPLDVRSGEAGEHEHLAAALLGAVGEQFERAAGGRLGKAGGDGIRMGTSRALDLLTHVEGQLTICTRLPWLREPPEDRRIFPSDLANGCYRCRMR